MTYQKKNYYNFQSNVVTMAIMIIAIVGAYNFFNNTKTEPLLTVVKVEIKETEETEPLLAVVKVEIEETEEMVKIPTNFNIPFMNEIGYKKLVCVHDNMERFVEVMAIILIPESSTITISTNPKYPGQVEAGTVYIHSIESIGGKIYSGKNGEYISGGYTIPSDFFSKYLCFAGDSDMTIYSTNFPSSDYRTDFYFDRKDAENVQLLEDKYQLTVSSLEKREIAMALSMMEIHSMFNDNIYNDDEKEALKYLALSCKGNLLGTTRRLNELGIERDYIVILIVEKAFNLVFNS